MGYIMNLRKYVGHEPLIGLGATTMVFNDRNEILLNLRSDTNTWGIPGGSMQDWINAIDDLLKFRRKKVLDNSGNISHKHAVEKAESEYEKYRVIQDQKYVSSMDEFYNKYLEENK